MTDQTETQKKPSRAIPYVKLALALAISLVVMFFLTMVQINVIDDFYFNLSNTYMALLMLFPMGIIMVVVMWSMFTNKLVNIVLIVALAAAFVAVLFMARTEALVGNEQFLKSMIPHHSRAILVCQESDITDPEIVALCDEIVSSQQREIDQMKEILKRY